MRLTVEDGTPIIGEVYSGAYLETAEGNRVGFCMRDDTIELNVMPKGTKENDCRWYRVNMQTREVDEMVVADDHQTAAIELTNAIIAELEKRHIRFEGRLTHTGRDMVAQEIVEPILRAMSERSKTEGGGSNG